MRGWRKTTTAELGAQNLIEIGDGYRAKNSEFVKGGGLPFVRVGDVGRSIRLIGLDELPLASANSYGGKISQAFDSVLTMKGTVGRVAFVSESDPLFVYSPQLSYWRSQDHVQLHPRWLRYWLESPEFLGQASGSKGSTDMADYINLRDQRRMRITLPPPLVQCRIAEVLATFDDLIQNNRRRIELLEQMAKTIYREWFVHFRYPGHEDVPLVDSSLGRIPEGWEVLTASEVLIVQPRLTLGREVAHPFVTMSDLRTQSMVCFPSERKTGNSGSKFQNGDTLFARITPCLENGKTGFVQCLQADEIGRGSTEFIVLRGNLAGPAFTYLLARDDGFRAHAIKSMSGASGRQRVRKECFDAFLLTTPPTHIAQRFEERAQPLFLLAQSLGWQIRALTEIRDLLLPKLVTGEIDVSDMDLDAMMESVA